VIQTLFFKQTRALQSIGMTADGAHLKIP